jgi:hypothetical protein
MNWSKAKSILILAFIILNAYLITQVVNLQESRIPVSEYTAVNERVTNLILEKYQVVPPAELPLGISPVDMSEVGFESINKQEIVASLWPDNPGTWIDEFIYQNEDEFLFVDDEMFYYLNEVGEGRVIESKETIMHHINLALTDPNYLDIVAPIIRVGFREATNLEFEGWLLESINETIENDISYYDILFIQDIGLPVYDAGSYTKIRMDVEGNIIGIKRATLERKEHERELKEVLLDLIDFKPKVKIISATEALLALVVNQNLEAQSEIKDIRLAYFGLTESSLVADQNVPEIWQLIPVWRLKVMTPNGDIVNYYLNAYTGELES